MTKYRILEIPQLDSDPIFRIEAWDHRLDSGFWSDKKIECWCSITKKGYPINAGYGIDEMISQLENMLESFKTYKEGKAYLDSIIEYRSKQPKVVFETEV